MSTLTEEEYYYKADNLIRTSCQALQVLFRSRWERATGSPWDETKIEEFISGIGSGWFKSAKNIQKKLFKAGVVDQWDVTLLSQLLLVFPLAEGSKAENAAIHSLAHQRNLLAHKGQGKLTPTEFQEFEDKFRRAVKSLGVMTEEDLDKLVTNAGVTSSVTALETAKGIQEQALKAEKAGRLEKAVKLCEEALQVPSLLPVNLSSIFEQRAGMYLKMGKSGDKVGFWEQAKKDAEEALALNENSWRGHLILGKIWRESDKLEKALEHLNRALAIAPGQQEVRHELDSCKLLAGQIAREEHLDPNRQPMNLKERVEHFTNETGKPMTEDLFLKMGKCSGKLIPGQDHVAKGHQYMMGWGVPVSPRDAATFYAKAAKLNNAEGIYNLATLHQDGKGVRQDFGYALELLRRAAALPPTIKLGGMQTNNVGVAEAQHVLGLMYQEGVGVPKDLREALRWYTKSVENGCGNAANNLGIMYAKGEGTMQDPKKAELYWKLAVDKKNANAAHSLYIYYVEQMEPDLARAMLDTAIGLGHDRLGGVKGQLCAVIQEVEERRKIIEGEVVAFEKKNKMSTRGLTFLERAERRMSALHPVLGRHFQDQKEMAQPAQTATKWAGKMKTKVGDPFDKEMVQDLVRKRGEGSVTAERVLRTIQQNSLLLQYFEEKGPPPFSKVDEEKLVDLLYAGVIMESHVLRIPDFMLEYVSGALFGGDPLEEDMDRKIRLIYAFFTFGKGGVDDIVLQILKEGIRRYPKEVEYYHMLSSFYGNINDYQSGLEFAEKGLARFPRNVELLYDRAVHRRLLQSDFGDENSIREAYHHFLEMAPEDHRKVPEAYYSIAVTYMASYRKSLGGGVKLDESMKEFYRRGQKAEKLQLKCYLPYESSSKSMLERVLELAEGPKLSEIPEAIPVEKKSKLHLDNPKRINLIKTHRENLKEMKNKAGLVPVPFTQAPKLVHKMPRSIVDLKMIKLAEMDPTKDHIYENRILSLTLIDEPVLGYPSVHALAQDENGDVTRLFVYNVSQTEDVHETLGFGCTLSVINPYMRLASDLINGIRVDDPKCLIFTERLNSACRYCGEEDAPNNCGRCKWAKYCGKGCQVADWKKLEHKLICKV